MRVRRATETRFLLSYLVRRRSVDAVSSGMPDAWVVVNPCGVASRTCCARGSSAGTGRRGRLVLAAQRERVGVGFATHGGVKRGGAGLTWVGVLERSQWRPRPIQRRGCGMGGPAHEGQAPARSAGNGDEPPTEQDGNLAGVHR